MVKRQPLAGECTRILLICGAIGTDLSRMVERSRCRTGACTVSVQLQGGVLAQRLPTYGTAAAADSNPVLERQSRDDLHCPRVAVEHLGVVAEKNVAGDQMVPRLRAGPELNRVHVTG